MRCLTTCIRAHGGDGIRWLRSDVLSLLQLMVMVLLPLANRCAVFVYLEYISPVGFRPWIDHRRRNVLIADLFHGQHAIVRVTAAPRTALVKTPYGIDVAPLVRQRDKNHNRPSVKRGPSNSSHRPDFAQESDDLEAGMAKN
jgi:hypothetical protein